MYKTKSGGVTVFDTTKDKDGKPIGTGADPVSVKRKAKQAARGADNAAESTAETTGEKAGENKEE